MMKRRDAVLALIALAGAPFAAEAQKPGKIYRIGTLNASKEPAAASLAELTDEFRKLGWIEGKNIAFERRWGNDQPDRMTALAEELVRLKVDVIFTVGTLAPLAAKRATSTIPIVMAAAGDPLGSGLVTSLARPGGNVTGMSMMIPEIGGKRLEIVREILPKVARVAILWNAANPYSANVYKASESAARTLKIQLQSLEVRNLDDFSGAAATALRQRAEALLVVEDPLTGDMNKQIIDFAAQNKLPVIYGLKLYVTPGGLMSYGASFPDLRRRAVAYVDKILKGAKPGDLPVEQPTKFELVVNLKAAKQIGLRLPRSLIARADEVIE